MADVETIINEAPETNPDATPVVDNHAEEIAKLKKLLSNANSEAAAYKRQLREKQSAEEQAASDAAEKQAAMEAELAELRKNATVAGYKAKYLGLGFDEEMATATAKAQADGDTETVFANLKSLAEGIEKNAIARALDAQKGLTVGEPAEAKPTYTKEDIEKMTPEQINANWETIKHGLNK